MTIKNIVVPKGLSEDEFVEFIREEVRKVGGDPDTLYPVDYQSYDNTEGKHVTFPLISVVPTFQVEFKYHNYEPDIAASPVVMEVKEYNNSETESVKKHLEMWSDFVKKG